MAMNSKSFPKSDFEVTDGNYLITSAAFVIPNPKSDDPAKQEKIDEALAKAAAKGQLPEVVLRLELAELDSNAELVDLEHTKRLDLKYGDTGKCRPFDEPDADLSDASDERGSEGRYAIPAAYAPHASSRPGFFLAALENVAGYGGLPTDCNDSACLVGLKISIRRKAMEGVKDKATGKVGEPWYQYEPYAILEDPNDAGTKKKVVKKAAPAKTEAPAKATPVAAKPPVKKTPPPPVEEEEVEEVEVDVEEVFTNIVTTAIQTHMKKNKTAPKPMQVRLASAIGISKLPADQQGPVKEMLKDNDMLQSMIDELTKSKEQEEEE